MLLVCQLEQQSLEGRLTLQVCTGKKHFLVVQKIWFYIQPMRDTLAILKELTSEMKEQKCYGGSMLNLIFHKYQQRAG